MQLIHSSMGIAGRVLDGWAATQGHTSRGLQDFVVVKASPSPKPATVVVQKVSPSPKPATVVVKKILPSPSPAVVVKQVCCFLPCGFHFIQAHQKGLLREVVRDCNDRFSVVEE